MLSSPRLVPSSRVARVESCAGDICDHASKHFRLFWLFHESHCRSLVDLCLFTRRQVFLRCSTRVNREKILLGSPSTRLSAQRADFRIFVETRVPTTM